MVCEVGTAAMDMSEGGAGAGVQQRWYDSRVNGSPAAGDGSETNGDGFFHSPLEGGHHSRARYYHQQMHAPYSPAVGSHEGKRAGGLPDGEYSPPPMNSCKHQASCKCNVGHASTCNTVGQTAGFFLGYVLFLALESPYFCNKYLRSVPLDTGLVTLSSFLLFWGWMFIVTTTLIAILKHEANEPGNSRENQVKGIKDIMNAYKQLYTIVKLPAVRTLALVLFTAKLGFCASDAVSGLKLVEAGVPREDLALLAVPLVPVQIIMPVILAKHTTGPAPLSLWLRAFPLRLLVGPLSAALVALTPSLLGDAGPSYSYLTVLMALYVFHQTCLYCMFVAVMAFFAKVSDPTVGGTYMTLLNTVSNLGTNWPNTLALWAIDHLTYKTCSAPELRDNTCSTELENDMCKSKGGTCNIWMDGFYIEVVLCFIAGFLWLLWGKKTINRLQRLPASAWQIGRNR